MFRLGVILVLLVFAGLCAGAAWPQAVNATLPGTVTDTSGAVAPNAKVPITETQTGVAHTAETNESGSWIVPNLPPGMYAVDVEVTGCALLVDTNTRIDVQLTPGDSATTGEKIESTVLANAPLVSADRNFQSLLNLAPAVAPVPELKCDFSVSNRES